MRHISAIAVLALGIFTPVFCADSDSVGAHITADVSILTPDSITDAIRRLNAAEQLDQSECVKLLCLIFGKIQDQFHDQDYVDNKLLSAFDSKAFQALDFHHQYFAMASILGGEGLANRREHASDAIYAGNLAVCLLKWLHRIDVAIDPHFDPKDIPTINPEAPDPYPSGVAPGDIKDPVARAAYEKKIAATDAALQHYGDQKEIIRNRRLFRELIIHHLPLMAPTKDASKELRKKCAKAGIPPNLLVDVFDTPLALPSSKP